VNWCWMGEKRCDVREGLGVGRGEERREESSVEVRVVLTTMVFDRDIGIAAAM
jgi:hypothetical protein